MLPVMKILACCVILGSAIEAVRPTGSRGKIQELVNEFCQNATDVITCQATVGKCFFRPPPGVKAAFCSCKDSTGVHDLHNTWIQDGGRDKCTMGGSRAPGGGSSVSFYQYLKDKSPTETTLFECCIGEKQGLFEPNGAVIVSAWKENAATIPFADALKAVNEGIDRCSTTVTACTPRDFITCVLQQCYSALSV